MSSPINSLGLLVHVLCIMTVICQSQSCSIGNFPRMIAISNANEIWTVDSYPALLLSQTASLCNGTVKKWRFCHTVIHSSGMADVIPNKISVGVWRPSDSNVYTLVDGSLVLLPLLKTYFQLDFLCKSFSVTPVDIMAGDSVGLVLHSIPSVFGILGANISGSNGVCVGTVEGDGYRFVNPNCSRSRYDFLLQGLTGGDDSLLAIQTLMPVEENKKSSTHLWVYVVLGTLSLLFAVAVFVIVVMIIQRCQQGKGNDDVVMATCACTRSSRGMEEKSLATQIGTDNQKVATSITSISRVNFYTNGNNGSYGKCQKEETCDTDALSHMFSYPPPASKAPLPPRESIICISDGSNPEPLEGDSIHEVHDGIGHKCNILYSPFDGSQSPVASDKFSDARGISGHGVGGISSENISEIFEVKVNNKAASPIAAPWKLQGSKEVSCENIPSVSSPIAAPRKLQSSQAISSSVLVHKLSKYQEGVAKQDSMNGKRRVTARNRIHQYANVKSKFGRMNSVPIMHASSPVYAEPTPVKNRARILSDSNSRETLRSSHSFQGFKSARKMATLPPGTPDNALMNIAEVDEVFEAGRPPAVDDNNFPILTTTPEDYLEPIHIRKNVM